MFCQPGYYFFNHELTYSPYNYLEIGVFNGDSIAGIAKTHPNRIIYGVDPFIEDGCTVEHTGVNVNEFMPTQKQNTEANIEGVENVVLFEMLSSELADALTDELVADMNVAWVLIDGSHHYDDVTNDYRLAMRLIGDRKGGVVFDDLNLPGVQQAYNEFLIEHAGRVSAPIDLYESEHPGHIIAHFINP